MKTVFIDLGANKGQSIVKAQREILQGTDYVIHSFETLPFLANALKKHYHKNENIHIYHAAAWIEETKIKFYVSSKSTESGTLLPEKTTGNIDTSEYILVPAINFSEWCLENLSKDDNNILKFDIEGAEYYILYHLIKEGTFKLFNSFYGEFHKNKLDNLSAELNDKVNFVHEYFKSKNINFNIWEAPSRLGVVDYKKGTKPSLKSSLISDYTDDGIIIPYDQ